MMGPSWGIPFLPPSVASVSMCTYGVLPACVNVTWLYLCQKSSTERRGGWRLVLSTKHLCKDNLQNDLQCKKNNRKFKEKKTLREKQIGPVIDNTSGNYLAAQRKYCWCFRISVTIYKTLFAHIELHLEISNNEFLTSVNWPSDGAFWIPFYQQLSSKNSYSCLPGLLYGEVIKVAIRDGIYKSR